MPSARFIDGFRACLGTFLLEAIGRRTAVPMVDIAQTVRIKKAIERLYKIVANIESEVPLTTSDKVALNFWLIDTERLKNQGIISQLHDLVSAAVDRGAFESDTWETLFKTCLEKFDPPDIPMRDFD